MQRVGMEHWIERKGRARGVLGVMASMVMVVSPVVSWAQESINAEVRAAVEYDNNALRTSNELSRGDMLTRYFLTLDGAYAVGSADVVSFSVRQGGKLFLELDGADTLLTQVFLSYQTTLWSQLVLGVNVDIKDRTERESIQDYNRGGVAASLAWRLPWLVLRAQGGWRYFAFKPDNSTGSDGPTVTAGVDVPITPTLGISGSYSWLSRRFDVRKFVRDDEGRFIQTEDLRRDGFHTVEVDLRWRGPVIMSLVLSYAQNQSNSYGQDLAQQRAALTLTAPLLWQWYGSLRGELIQTSFEDPIFIDTNFQVDEDNRNTLVMSLARPFGEGWDVELKYSLYTQALGSDASYNRQTFSVALGWEF